MYAFYRFFLTLGDFYPRDVYVSAVHTATLLAGWVAGCLSVTRRYCNEIAKPILKLVRPSGSPIILVSFDPAPILNSKGNPFSGGCKYTGCVKIWRFSTEISVYLGNGAR